MQRDPDQIISYICTFFDRAGPWFLTDWSLVEFITNRRLTLDDLHIGMVDTDPAALAHRCEVFGTTLETVGEGQYRMSPMGANVHIDLYTKGKKGWLVCGKKMLRPEWIRLDEEAAQEMKRKRAWMSNAGFWRMTVDELCPNAVNTPFEHGQVCDALCPGWFQKVEHLPFDKMSVPYRGAIYFDDARVESGLELIEKMYDCAREVGIEKAMFIGFGTLLGYIMLGRMVPKDNDLDMCIMSDWVTPEQQNAYVEELKKRGLNAKRWRTPSVRTDTNAPVWLSLGDKCEVSQHGTHSCNWFFFDYQGYWFHSKGDRWVSPTKINRNKISYSMTDEAISLGLPKDRLNKLVEVEWMGQKVLIPDNPGACCDWWYPGWCLDGDGASAHRVVLVHPSWKNEKSWRLFA